jgi:hypothetical protein
MSSFHFAWAEKPLQTLWLDKPLTSWNQPGSALPKPASNTLDSNEKSRCKDRVRKPSDALDQSLLQAGWTPFGPVHTFGKTSVVTAMSGVDLQCRPLGYQGFVFVEGKFAGALSPGPMESRTDGALDLNEIRLANANDLEVKFLRYAKSDPDCCPSQTQVVTYKLDKGLLIPKVKGDPQAERK